ncbi:MAG: DNA-directed RNA polymerase subunit omega [Rubricoccaceae bacterium]|nr:DNA-directed RNA polymerase subunit omega [Rubricoccaceae bacterium]
MAAKTIETHDITALAEKTGNIYESVVVLSRRARQISTQTKTDLDQQLSYFDDLTLIEPGDELRTNDDQLKISLEFERRPKATALAIEEMENDEVYYRHSAGGEQREF